MTSTVRGWSHSTTIASRPATTVEPVIRQSPVARTFWQKPAGWTNRSGSDSVWSGVTGV